ncbi:MAG: hypothetical protein BMS9Abin28_1374 [Anaerolineae bacterium]|nr:MAG: hypothetical protein BMS9Abin28_1374 [Anaerolineae bacterium]
MTDPTIALLDYLRKIGADLDGDFLRDGVQLLTQMLIELEAEDQIGAAKYERSPSRKARRNGYRERMWETRVGEIPLSIPKLREGTFFPSLLEPRKRSEKALLAVVHPCRVQADGLHQGGEHPQSKRPAAGAGTDGDRQR